MTAVALGTLVLDADASLDTARLIAPLSAAVANRSRLAALRATGLLDAPASDALERLTRVAARLLGVPTTLVSLVDADRQFFAAHTGLSGSRAVARQTPLSHSFCRHVVEAGEALVVENAREHPVVRDNPAIDEHGLVAYAGVPLRTSDGHLLGSFCAIDDRPRRWSAEDLATLDDLAQAAVSMMELHSTASTLGGATNALRELLDETTELVCAADADGRLTYANEAWLDAFGYTLEQAIGMRALDFVAPEDRPRYLASARRLHAGARIVEFEAVLLAADGRRVVCRGRARSELRDDPAAPNGRRCVATTASYRDVTAERQVEAARARLVAMVEATSDFVGTAAPDGSIHYLNRAGRRLLGLGDDADVSGLRANAFHPPETLARLADEAFPAVQRDGSWTGEGVLLAAGGERIPVSMGLVAHPSLVPGEPPYFTAIMRDLRERVRVEDALRNQKQQLRAVVDNAAIGITLIAPDGTLQNANPAFHAFLGYEPGTLIGQYAPALSPAEDAAVTRGPVAALKAGTVPSVTVEKRFLRKDGAVRLAELTMTQVPLADGRMGLVGLTTDVTERRAAEDALVASEARYRAAIEGSLDAFMAMRSVRDVGGTIVDFEVVEASTRAAEMVGMTRDALVGQHLCQLFPIAHQAGHFKRYVEVVETRTTLEWEFIPTDPRVVARAVRTQAVPLEDGLALSLRDVTERWRAETALREIEARVRGAVEASLDALFILRATRSPEGAVEDFAIVDCNQRGAAFAHTMREELVGRSAGAVFREARRRGLLDACARVLETGEPYSIDYHIDASTNPPAWAWLQVVRVGDGVAITARDITAQKASEAALRELALVDELTGVHNRRGFLTAAEREWHRATRERHGAMLVYIDLDGFKQINDTHGHAEGDRALRTVGDVLRAAFRGGDVVGRLGGDEFAILVVPSAGAAPSPSEVERMIRERLERQLAASNTAARAAGREYDISFSVGVAHAQPGSLGADGAPASLTALMVEADERLYTEKHARRQRRG